MPVAAPTYWNVTMGQPRNSGRSNAALTPATAVAGDFSVVFTNASNVKTAGAFLAACQDLAKHLQSSGLLS